MAQLLGAIDATCIWHWLLPIQRDEDATLR